MIHSRNVFFLIRCRPPQRLDVSPVKKAKQTSQPQPKHATPAFEPSSSTSRSSQFQPELPILLPMLPSVMPSLSMSMSAGQNTQPPTPSTSVCHSELVDDATISQSVTLPAKTTAPASSPSHLHTSKASVDPGPLFATPRTTQKAADADSSLANPGMYVQSSKIVVNLLFQLAGLLNYYSVPITITITLKKGYAYYYYW